MGQCLQQEESTLLSMGVANFSIIIPTLNEEPSILSCLHALQPLRDRCEIIVVDGGSKDNTRSLAQPFPDKLVISRKGRASQMNAGAQLAKGAYLIFLHADSLLPANAFDHLVQSLNTSRNSPQQWGRFDVELSGKHFMLKVIALFMNWRSRITGIATGDQAIFVSKTLFDSVGHYPEIALMEDIALCKKLKKISPPVCLSSKVTSSGRRWEQYGIGKTILLMWSLRLRYFFGTDPQALAVLYNRGQFWKT
jgi:rSAM/selenodomain-associated transferase 2